MPSENIQGATPHSAAFQAATTSTPEAAARRPADYTNVRVIGGDMVPVSEVRLLYNPRMATNFRGAASFRSLVSRGAEFVRAGDANFVPLNSTRYRTIFNGTPVVYRAENAVEVPGLADFFVDDDTVELHDGTRVDPTTTRTFCCGRCDERYRMSEATRVSGSNWCQECVDERAVECPACQTYVDHELNDVSDTDGFDHDEVCDRCFARRDESSIFGRLLSYSDRSASHLPSEGKGRIKYGLEVEVHVANGASIEHCVRHFAAVMGTGYAICKSDGSLDHGFEIVTRPDTMDIHRGKWKAFFLKLAEGRTEGARYLKAHLRSWTAPRACCGIHCHVSKAPLTQMQLGKMLVFLNADGTRTLIERVAGRGANSYTSFERGRKVLDGKVYKNGTSGSRYVALNVGDQTAELRIFRGTLNPASFFKNLDFVEALVDWTSLANCSVRDATSPDAFLHYVFKSGRFSSLRDKLIEWNFTPAPAAK